MRRRNAIPRNNREGQARERALAALALMRREKRSLKAAAKAQGTDPRTVRRYVGTAIRQDALRHRYKPTASDRLARSLNVITPGGTQAVTVRDSRTASRIAEHSNAVRKYVRTGDTSGLELFKNKSFRVARVVHRFVIDTDTLDNLADAGSLATIESLYYARMAS